VPHFEYASRCDPGNRDAAYRLALSRYALGDTTRAISQSEMFMTEFPSATEGYLLRGAIAYQQSDLARCDSLFRIAFSVAPPGERAALVDIRLLLPDDRLDTYAAASDDKRRDLERIFWAEHDPDPTTPLNERYLEHVQRMFLADTFFDSVNLSLRGWETERGRAVVKFGWPDGMDTTLDGESLSSPMEVWAYDNPFIGLTLFFRDEFLNGNYMVPMDYGYAHAAQSLYLDSPVSHFVSPYWQIPGVMQVLSFSDDSAATDVYVALDVDLATMKDYIDIGACKRFFLRINFFDDTWRPRALYADTLDPATLVDNARGEKESFILVRRYTLGYDSLLVASCLEDDLSRTQTLLDGQTNTRRYLNTSLVTSDILLYRPSSNASANAIVRGNRAFLPHPSGKYGKGEKLGVYLEVYNLARFDSRTDYEIRYSIFAARAERPGWHRVARTLRGLMGFDEREEPVIAHTLHRQGTEHVAEENLTIAIDELEPGDYILQISVTDRASGDVATQYGKFSKALDAAMRPVAAR
jgi:GWxTD domain-containing protein